jgi:universal stress protein F
MFNIILVPIDIAHPERVKSSLAAASKLASAHDSKLVLLHVVEQLPGYALTEVPDGFRASMMKATTEEFKTFAAAQELPATTQVLVREGHVYHTILSVARDVGADLIVIASHNPVMADYLLGSVAARVVRHAHCSVLVLRDAGPGA